MSEQKIELTNNYWLEKRDENNIALVKKFKPSGVNAKKNESIKTIGYFGTQHGAVKRFLEIAPYEDSKNLKDVFEKIIMIKNEILEKF